MLNYAQQGIRDSKQFITDNPATFRDSEEILEDINFDEYQNEQSIEEQVSSYWEVIADKNNLELETKELENITDLEVFLNENSLGLTTENSAGNFDFDNLFALEDSSLSI